MDPFTAKWLSEFDVADPAVNHQWQMKYDSLYMNRFSPETYSTYPSSSMESSIQQGSPSGITKQLNNNNFSSYTYSQRASQKATSSPTPNMISFGQSNSLSRRTQHGNAKCNVKTEPDVMALGEIYLPEPISPSSIEEVYGVMEYGEPIKKVNTRTPLQAQDHVLSERKRREKLSERFVALSAIVPGLKKLDKASVLGGAIKYLKQLEGRVKKLDEEKKRKYEESAAVAVKRPRLCSHDDNSSSDNEFENNLDQSSPEIEVRTSDGNVLLSVYCQKCTGIIQEIFCEVENLHLSIINSSVMPFGNTTLQITIVARMNGDYPLTAQDLAGNIRNAILKLM